MKSVSTLRRHAKAIRAKLSTYPVLDDALTLEQKVEVRCLYIAEQTLLWALADRGDWIFGSKNPQKDAEIQAAHIMREHRANENREQARRLSRVITRRGK